MKPIGRAMATAARDAMRLVLMASVIRESSKTARKLSRVNLLTSMSPLQKLESPTTTSANTGRIVAMKL